jgi:hypothetical protein
MKAFKWVVSLLGGVGIVGVWVAGAGLAADTQEGEKQGVFHFSKDDLGKVPKGWTVAITGKGEPKWTVESDESAPDTLAVLKQSAVVPGSSFPLCIKDAPTLKDGFVEVKFKSVSGKEDQGAGVIWRCADKDNYYICRANAIEDNVVLYKVEKGKRTSLDIVGRKGGYGVEEPVAKQTWHTLRVEFAGNRAKVMLNGKHLFDVEDQTFKEAGKVGLWTKADSVMLFNDFSCGAK